MLSCRIDQTTVLMWLWGVEPDNPAKIQLRLVALGKIYAIYVQ